MPLIAVLLLLVQLLRQQQSVQLKPAASASEQSCLT